jgi:hypothetical protein
MRLLPTNCFIYLNNWAAAGDYTLVSVVYAFFAIVLKRAGLAD